MRGDLRGEPLELGFRLRLGQLGNGDIGGVALAHEDQRSPTSPWRGEVGERQRREPGGGEAASPHPARFARDPPPPGEGEEYVARLGSKLYSREIRRSSTRGRADQALGGGAGLLGDL